SAFALEEGALAFPANLARVYGLSGGIATTTVRSHAGSAGLRQERPSGAGIGRKTPVWLVAIAGWSQSGFESAAAPSAGCGPGRPKRATGQAQSPLRSISPARRI